MNTLHLVGAGGHGRVVYDAAASTGKYDSILWYDDAWDSLESLGPVNGVLPLSELIDSTGFVECFVSIGGSQSRMRLLEAIANSGKKIASIFHARSYVSSYSKIGIGCVVMAGAVVQTCVEISDGVIVNTSASVDHDCRLGRGVHVAPGAHLAGSVAVGELTMIGAGSVVREGIAIGSRVMVGAGAVVVADVPDGMQVLGNPARISGPNNVD